MGTNATADSKCRSNQKLALVIGIGDYDKVPKLKSPSNDSMDMEKKLKSIGFHVTKRWLDLLHKDMVSIVKTFITEVQEGDTVFIYFSGYGTLWKDEYYLLPKDFDGKSEKSNKNAAPVWKILDKISNQHPFVIILALDCCIEYRLKNDRTNRNRPSISDWDSSPFDLPSKDLNTDAVIAFACNPGSASIEKKEERNSLFTKHILQYITKPDEDILTIFDDVKKAVTDHSKSRQTPIIISTLSGKNVYLHTQGKVNDQQCPFTSVPKNNIGVPKSKRNDSIEMQFSEAEIQNATTLEYKNPTNKSCSHTNQMFTEQDNTNCESRVLGCLDKSWLDLSYHQHGEKLIKRPHELCMPNPPMTVDNQILNRIQGSMIGMALGDALGAHVEFRPRAFLVSNPVSDLEAGGTWGLEKGQFTDDTSMALCLAASLVYHGDFIPYDQLVRYKWWHKHGYMSSTGQCFDIGAATCKSLREFEARQKEFAKVQKIPMDEVDYVSGADRLSKFDVNCSEPDVAGNGALMRLTPVPLFFYRRPTRAVEYSGISGVITHGDSKASDACRYYGALIVAALHGASKEELLDTDFYENHKSWFGKFPLVPEIMRIARGSYQKKGGYEDGIRGKGYIVDALEAALWAFWSEETFENGVLAAVNLGDDTDTTAAIYGQLAGAYYGYRELPQHWVNQVYAKDFILGLSEWISYEGSIWHPNKLEKNSLVAPAVALKENNVDNCPDQYKSDTKPVSSQGRTSREKSQQKGSIHGPTQNISRPPNAIAQRAQMPLLAARKEDKNDRSRFPNESQSHTKAEANFTYSSAQKEQSAKRTSSRPPVLNGSTLLPRIEPVKSSVRTVKTPFRVQGTAVMSKQGSQVAEVNKEHASVPKKSQTPSRTNMQTAGSSTAVQRSSAGRGFGATSLTSKHDTGKITSSKLRP
ncbi:unnamed protein product [Rotaria socialis]|uniref:Peptidase C14 caspase domain-containing protein n=2 Tax=Rotaria socialis TaxID=392032 RepID=A0A820TIP7_9BILA|nr:unnamed protein product [Rotaria socialis]CAF3441289.1 unnamed protein product [Rotaria socialis]CAF4466901.1 unnamed protein product [Rotaria socialis]CAF4486245.1 unnamed protein product [Rotaria socialis]CAF4746988.1 unnamed protein product [Rotaria socialis]